MDSVYSKFYTGNGSRYNNLSRSGSVPLFNVSGQGGRLPSCLTLNSKNVDKPIVTPEILKMQMMEERIKNLERQKKDQSQQLNTLMEYQLNQNKLHKSNSTVLLPVNQPQPNALLLTANNVIRPLNYQNNLNEYYQLHNLHNNGGYNYNYGNDINRRRKKYSITSMTDNDFYTKKKKASSSLSS